MEETKKRKKDNTKNVYPCDQCEYVATKKSNLDRHKRIKHEGIRYPCDQCDFAASQQGHLKGHKEITHEGIRYPCDQCEYSAIKLSYLKIHKESKHVGIRYFCDQCECTYTCLSDLRKHRKHKHMTASSHQPVSTSSILPIEVEYFYVFIKDYEKNLYLLHIKSVAIETITSKSRIFGEYV